MSTWESCVDVFFKKSTVNMDCYEDGEKAWKNNTRGDSPYFINAMGLKIWDDIDKVLYPL